jgi:hypothetical protein
MEIFTTSSDYYTSLAIALLSARVEIFITAFMFSLELILTRPPLPPTRLDQIIQYKVNQGVKFYFLINKQVFALPLSFSLCLCSASLSSLTLCLCLSLSCSLDLLSISDEVFFQIEASSFGVWSKCAVLKTF